ncbi:MAG: hypothetical protein ACYDH4_09925 [Candidatus Cryosericum sp.]
MGKKPKKSRMTQMELPMHPPSQSVSPPSAKPVQMALPLGDDTVLVVPPKPTKAERKAASAERERLKHRRREARNHQRLLPKFLGRDVPQPKTPDGKPYTCPCGRIYILPRLSSGEMVRRAVLEKVTGKAMPGATRARIVWERDPGGFIYFDKEGPLGRSTLGNGYCERSFRLMLATLKKHGCALHEREDQRRREGAW